MAKAVIDLQEDIINNKSDIVSVLRKAHVIASKLDLSDFDNWIQNELNGYTDSKSIPPYREVVGEIKAHNPYRGLIPVLMPSNIAKILNNMKLNNPISQIYELSKKGNGGTIELPTETAQILCEEIGTVFPCYFIFSNHYLVGIIDSVKNTVLEWCIRLEKDGIVGDDLQFNSDEKKKAKRVPQQINNYYGQVINGNVESAQVEINYLSKYEEIDCLIDEIKQSLLKEKIQENGIDEACSLLSDIKEMVQEKKKPNLIKASLLGLKDFLINVGASITANLIIAKIDGMF